jgi:hypothetical protein
MFLLAQPIENTDSLVMSEKEIAAFLAPASNTSSTYRGVSRTRCGKWIAQIRCDGELFHLGTFDMEDDAADAYDRKAFELRGTHTRFNFPDRVYGLTMRVHELLT